jgi:hypothetical protein
MNGFNLTELEAGEEMLFGPVTSVKTTSLSGGAGSSQGSISKSSGRAVGITNRRIIIEDMQNPDRSQTIPNEQVQRVSIKRKKQGITVARVQAASGTVKVNLPGVSPQKESLLATTFPNAEISAAKGISKGVMIAAAVVVGFIVLCCHNWPYAQQIT